MFSLGLVLHAAWLLKERSTVLTFVHDFIHSFRMQSFFIIAGLFAAMMLSKYSPDEFLRRRLQRLAIPMIFCGLTFNTILACANQENWYDISFLLTADYWLERNWVAHLWFLGTLILYVLVIYGVHKLWPGIDRFVRRQRLSFVSFFGLVVVAQYVVSKIGEYVPSTPWGTSWIIADKIDTFDYWIYFVAGYILFHHEELLDELIDHRLLNGVCVTLYWLTIALISGHPLGRPLGDLMAAANGFAMCGLLFWVSKRYFSAGNPLVRSFSDMSYTVYLVHWPFMVVLNRILLPVNLPVATAFSILVIATGALSIGFYWCLVRRSDFLAFFMNGQRARSVQARMGHS